MTKRLSWIAVGIVVIAALVAGTRPQDTKTDEERAQDIAATIACPACNGQSVASSDAIASENIRTEISRRVADGESDDEIRAAFAARFGDDILLNPPRSGVAGLVWVIPVVGVVAAGAGLTVAFRRWRRGAVSEDEDFLRRSIDDLEREHDAGDLSDDDYAELRARYEAKLAGDRPGPPRKGRSGRGRKLAWVAVVAVVGVGAGLAMARFAGERDPGQEITGRTPATAQGRLADAADLFGEGDAQGAIEIYQELLDENPEDVAALTYFGWTLRNVGVQQEDDRLQASGTRLIEQALAIDPTYAEAWFFRGILYLRDEDDPDGAVDALRLALANDPIPEIEGAARELLAEIAQSS